MRLFLTSSPCSPCEEEGVEIPCQLNEENNFVKCMKERWKPESKGLIISASPDQYELNDEMRSTFEQAFEYHGMTLLQMLVCDYRNSQDVEEMLKESDFVLLAGGHVPTQNAFFHQIRLRELMRTFDGIVMGISAGTMNSADVVYAQPELAGESLDSDYQRYIEGLNLTWVNVLPHYQEVKDNLLDGRRLMEDITYSDSWGHRFYALIDGSYILVENGRTEIFGEAYLISDGTISKICEKGQSMRIER